MLICFILLFASSLSISPELTDDHVSLRLAILPTYTIINGWLLGLDETVPCDPSDNVCITKRLAKEIPKDTDYSILANELKSYFSERIYKCLKNNYQRKNYCEIYHMDYHLDSQKLEDIFSKNDVETMLDLPYKTRLVFKDDMRVFCENNDCKKTFLNRQ